MMDIGRANTTEEHFRQLMMRGLDGDSRTYHEFLKDITPYLRAFFRKRLSSLPDEVEDLVQETLLAIHNHRHTYDPAQPLTAWVCAIAKYKFVDLLRRRAGREKLNDPIDEESEIFSSTDSEASEARRDLSKLLDRLPDQFRLPIVHTRLEGLSVMETAKLTGMSESAIKVGVHRGLKALAQLIRSES